MWIACPKAVDWNGAVGGSQATRSTSLFIRVQSVAKFLVFLGVLRASVFLTFLAIIFSLLRFAWFVDNG